MILNTTRIHCEWINTLRYQYYFSRTPRNDGYSTIGILTPQMWINKNIFNFPVTAPLKAAPYVISDPENIYTPFDYIAKYISYCAAKEIKEDNERYIAGIRILLPKTPKDFILHEEIIIGIRQEHSILTVNELSKKILFPLTLQLKPIFQKKPYLLKKFSKGIFLNRQIINGRTINLTSQKRK